MDIEVNRMFPAAISRFKTLRPQQRYARLKVRLPLTMLHHIPRPFGLGIFCCHSPARNSKPGISLYRGCSFLDGCGILSLVQ